MVKAKNMVVIVLLGLMLCFLVPSTNVAALQEEGVKSSILIESESGEVLQENNSHQKLAIASVTKLMTILLTLEKLDEQKLTLDQTIIASKTAAQMGGSQVFLEEGGEYKVLDLLKSVIISSANDSSVLLAETISGSEKNFVEEMNKRAAELNLQNTHYNSATGLPAPMQYSSAYDVAVVMREVLKHPLYLKLSGIWMEDFSHPKGRITGMANTNKLLKQYEFCDGGKTGYTNEAGFCLCATAKKDDFRLISVVLGADSSKTRFNTTKEMLDYGFNNFEVKKLVDKSQNFGDEITISKSKNKELSLHAETDCTVVVKKDENAEFEAKFEAYKNLCAPIEKGCKVGEIKIFKNGELFKTVGVITTENIQEQSYFNIIQSITKRWLI